MIKEAEYHERERNLYGADNRKLGTQKLRQSVRPTLVQTVQYPQAATLQNDHKHYKLGEVKTHSGPRLIVCPRIRDIQRKTVPNCRNCEEIGHRFIDCAKPKMLCFYISKTESLKTTDCRRDSGSALWIPDLGGQLRSRYNFPKRPPTGNTPTPKN
ncbi:hypothetical protein J6590_040406 [Homalodisca vitripennis]|nr:hypothetical protein J6590_040406 [Homalodisca vitripennis]